MADAIARDPALLGMVQLGWNTILTVEIRPRSRRTNFLLRLWNRDVARGPLHETPNRIAIPDRSIADVAEILQRAATIVRGAIPIAPDPAPNDHTKPGAPSCET